MKDENLQGWLFRDTLIEEWLNTPLLKSHEGIQRLQQEEASENAQKRRRALRSILSATVVTALAFFGAALFASFLKNVPYEDIYWPSSPVLVLLCLFNVWSDVTKIWDTRKTFPNTPENEWAVSSIIHGLISVSRMMDGAILRTSSDMTDFLEQVEKHHCATAKKTAEFSLLDREPYPDFVKECISVARSVHRIELEKFRTALQKALLHPRAPLS
jgi:hypothetical protein